jgi:hypothetical protein
MPERLHHLTSTDLISLNRDRLRNERQTDPLLMNLDAKKIWYCNGLKPIHGSHIFHQAPHDLLFAGQTIHCLDKSR